MRLDRVYSPPNSLGVSAPANVRLRCTHPNLWRTFE
jgi:hypothetical protein